MIFANTGIPILFFGLPFMVILFIPVALIEALWYLKTLKVPLANGFRKSCSANFVSTALALPLAWLIWAIIGIGCVKMVSSSGLVSLSDFVWSKTWGYLYLLATSGWMIPGETIGRDAFRVSLYASTLVLLLPAYLISYQVEAKILMKAWPHLEPKRVYRQVWFAHLLTYGLLYLIAVFRFCQVMREIQIYTPNPTP